MIDQLAADAAVNVLNRLLARETWARERLAPFAGRSARIEGGPFAIQFAVGADGTLEAGTGEASVTLAIDPAAAPQLLLDPQALLRNVRLSGDAEFAQALSFVLQNLRPEPEEALSRWVGDAASQRIVGFTRAAFAQAQEARRRLASTTADYLVAENPMLVARTDFEAFAREVTANRDSVERLVKRIEMLERG